MSARHCLAIVKKENSGDGEIHFDHSCVRRFISLQHRLTPHADVLTSNFLQGCTCLYRCREQLCLRFPSPWEGLATETHRKEKPPTPARAPPQSPPVSGPSEAGPDSTSGAASQGQVAGFSAQTGPRRWLKEMGSTCTPGRLAARGLESTGPFPRQPFPGVRSSRSGPPGRASKGAGHRAPSPADRVLTAPFILEFGLSLTHSSTPGMFTEFIHTPGMQRPTPGVGERVARWEDRQMLG